MNRSVFGRCRPRTSIFVTLVGLLVLAPQFAQGNKHPFRSFTGSLGITGRWKAGRNAQAKLVETGNFKQEATNFLSWSGTGVGASKHSTAFVTIRNGWQF